MLNIIKSRIKLPVSNPFIKNLLYLGSSEVINRVFRLLNTVVLARMLTKQDYGLIAIIMLVTEFARILTLGTGVGTKLIQADESEVKELANTCYWLNWIIGISLFFVECAISIPTSIIYHDPRLIAPICVTALIFLGIPIGQTHFDLTTRTNNMKVIAKLSMITSFTCNLLAIALALLGFGFWSVVIPQVLSSFMWGIYYYFIHPFRPSGGFTLYRYKELISVGFDVIAIEFLNKLRNNVDYMLVGSFLGVQALGLYYFAFNAGLGISLSVTGAFTTTLFPYLCQHRNEPDKLKTKFKSTAKTIACVIIPLVLLQSSLAQFYVPIVFGTKWVPAIPVLILICLSAIPRPFGEGAGQLLNAIGKTRTTLAWGVIFTIIFSLSIIISVQWGILAVALAVLLSHWICLPAFALWVYFRKV